MNTPTPSKKPTEKERINKKFEAYSKAIRKEHELSELKLLRVQEKVMDALMPLKPKSRERVLRMLSAYYNV